MFNINESQERIDISIQKAEKYLISAKRKEEFLRKPVKIYEKLDGIKINLYHIDKTGEIDKDWIVTYKNQIIYSTEYDYLSNIQIKNSSINNSQFKFIFDHLKKIDSKTIPVNYEFFIEYLMKKPTLSSNYKYNHKMVLLACSPSKVDVSFGRVTSQGSFDISKRDEFAKLLKVDTPALVFDGILIDFENGCKSKELLGLYNQHKNIITDDETRIQAITDSLLQLNSKYGNTPEGFVLDFGDVILKVQQAYQTDQNARADIKNQFRMDPEEENRYWDLVRLQALNIINKLKRPFKTIDLPDLLSQAANQLKNLKTVPEHAKKNKVQVLDDIQGNIKMIITKQLKGNNNVLFLGKMRILTKAHYKIINDASKKYDGVVVCLVTGSDTKFSRDLRYKMLTTAFKGNSKVYIIEHSNGNLFSIMNKAPVNINSVLCGSDRYRDYTKLLSRNPDIDVVETPRNSSDVSATFVIKNLANQIVFKSNTPKEIHSMYDEIFKFYSKNTPNDIDLNESYEYYDDTEEIVSRIFESKKLFDYSDLDLNLNEAELDLSENVIIKQSEIFDCDTAIKLIESLEQLREASASGKYNVSLDAASKSDTPKEVISLVSKTLKMCNNPHCAFPQKWNNTVKIGRACYDEFRNKLDVKTALSKFDYKVGNTDVTFIMGNGSVGTNFKDASTATYSEMGVVVSSIVLLAGLADKSIINSKDAEKIDTIIQNTYNKLRNFKFSKYVDGPNGFDVDELARNVIIWQSSDNDWFISNMKNAVELNKLIKGAGGLGKVHIYHEASSLGKTIKDKGAALSSLTADKWNPADLFLIKKDLKASDISGVKDIAILNYMFGSSLDDGIGSTTKILDETIQRVGFSISLKKEVNGALHGSAAVKSLQSYNGVNIKWNSVDDINKVTSSIEERCKKIVDIVSKWKDNVYKLPDGASSFATDNDFVNLFANAVRKHNKNIPETYTSGHIWWNYYATIIGALDDLKKQNYKERLFKIACLGMSVTEVSCPHYKFMASVSKFMNPDNKIESFEVGKTLVSLNGTNDCYINIRLNNEDYSLHVRSKGGAPQFNVMHGEKDVGADIEG